MSLHELGLIQRSKILHYLARSPGFRPPVRGEKKRVEAKQHGERDQNFVSLKIFFADEKFTCPADLHDCRSESGERGEKIPAAIERDDDESGVEDGDVAEKSERIVLTGGK